MSYQKKNITQLRQFNEITHTYAQKHRFKMRYLPEIENIKENQTEILELKKLINEMENAINREHKQQTGYSKRKNL